MKIKLGLLMLLGFVGFAHAYGDPVPADAEASAPVAKVEEKPAEPEYTVKYTRDDKPTLNKQLVYSLVYEEGQKTKNKGSSALLLPLIKELLVKRGYTLSDKTDLDNKIIISASYGFNKPRLDKNWINYEDVFYVLNQSQTLSGGGKTADLGTEVAGAVASKSLLDAGLKSGLQFQGDILKSLLDLTGISGSINKWLSGDERGWCLTNCATWNWFEQTATLVIGLSSKATDRVLIKVMRYQTVQKDMIPVKLFVGGFDRMIQDIDNAK